MEKQQTVDLTELITKTKILSIEQFTPWNRGNIQGVYRKLLFARNSLLGEISRYYSEDFIIWKYTYPDDYINIQKKWNGNTSTFLSRFIFLHPSLTFNYKRKSIWFGFRGYMDLIVCPFPLTQQELHHPSIRDIAPFLLER